MTRACSKRSNVMSPRRTHANTVGSQYKSQLKCFKRGNNHRLSACTKATQDKKNKIYSKKFPDGKSAPRPQFTQQATLFRTPYSGKTFKPNQVKITPVKKEDKE